MKQLLAWLWSAMVALSLAAPAGADGPHARWHESSASPWNGIYLGASIGYSYGLSDLTHDYVLPPPTRDTYQINQDGLFATLSAGFDRHLTPRIVWGFFGEYTLGEIKDRVTLATPGNVDLRFTLEDSWAAGGRLGLVHDGALWYATAGYSGINVSLADSNGIMHGYFVGAGIEKDITNNTRLKLEYRFSDYGSETLFDGVSPCCVSDRLAVNSSIHSVQLGLSYVFGAREAYAPESYK